MSNKSGFTIAGHSVEVANLDKVMFPDDGITKGQLLNYYTRIAPVFLKHVQERPLSFQRFPDGINEQGFFQKNSPGYYPDWIQRVIVEGKSNSVKYALAGSPAELVYFSQQGVITYHTWLSRHHNLHHPDLMVFDLDPDEQAFSSVQRSALNLRNLLSELGLPGFVKTTGSRGVHVTVPLDSSCRFDQVKTIATAISKILVSRFPDQLTIESRVSKRNGRIFIDTVRNRFGQTVVAPYSVRAISGAPIAVPVSWEELADPNLTSQSFNINNIFSLLEKRSDPWNGIYEQGQALDKVGRQLNIS